MIFDELKKKLVEYQKDGDQTRVGILRYFISQVQNKEIELRSTKADFNDEVVFKVLKKLVKDRKEVIEIYKKANRQELLDKETRELEILREFAKYFPYDIDAVPVYNKK